MLQAIRQWAASVDQVSEDRAAELPRDWWTTDDVAAFLGVAPSTVRAYSARQQMPAADRRIGRMQLWRPRTITKWNAERPRVGGAQSTAESGS